MTIRLEASRLSFANPFKNTQPLGQSVPSETASAWPHGSIPRVAMNRARTESLWSINAMAAVDVTPGEALLLLEPNKRQGSEAIKVSLMWLLAKKCLTASLEDKPGFLGRFLSRTSRLHPSDRLPADLPSEMDNLM